MKRSVTGGEDWAAAHKGKALVLRWWAQDKGFTKRRIRMDSDTNIVTNLYLYMELIQHLHVEEHKLIYPKLV